MKSNLLPKGAEDLLAVAEDVARCCRKDAVNSAWVSALKRRYAQGG